MVLAVATGARPAPAATSDPGICARCHDTQAALATFAGGHAPALDCVTCHEDRRPGVFGHRHRTIPTSCTSHHATQTHPDPGRTLGPAKLRRSCLKCHDVHGSGNAHLVRTDILVRGRLRPVEFRPDAEGTLDFVDPVNPGRGLCEICHQGTKFYPANGHAQPHFTGNCTLCHDHAHAFAPVVTDANCATCHPAEAAKLAGDSLHHDKFTGRCSACHAELMPDPGPGHRAKSACADCHSPALVAPHVPPGIPIACTDCHDPHGSDNIRLVRDVIRTVQGADRAVRFDDAVTGRADGSFASASAPGTGLCEVCHTLTQFYRADGTGAAHYVTTCTRCHPHSAGFLPANL
jgi:predicted CXXCH cytochrome family protein